MTVAATAAALLLGLAACAPESTSPEDTWIMSEQDPGASHTTSSDDDGYGHTAHTGAAATTPGDSGAPAGDSAAPAQTAETGGSGR